MLKHLLRISHFYCGKLFLVVSAGLLVGFTSLAVLSQAIDAYDFESELDRARYQYLVQELRCPKCQNQNLSDSNSAIAIDLRNEVARMIIERLDDDEIKEYMVNRYGDFVLYRPPVQNNTLVLWWGPVGMLLMGALIFLSIVLRRRAIAAQSE